MGMGIQVIEEGDLLPERNFRIAAQGMKSALMEKKLQEQSFILRKASIHC
ncbi:MAG: hypothetical protein WD604_08140 [Balneolaceae bacterium]